MMASNMKISLNICRFCLKTVWLSKLAVINDSQRDIIQIVLPQIDLDRSENVKICEDCAKLLEKSFTFKSKCLEIEDSIQDYKENEQDRINLEKVLGVNNDGNSKCRKICRMCLKYLENIAFMELDKENDLKSLIDKCFPEIDIGLTLGPVICQICAELVMDVYNFTTLCNKNEERNIVGKPQNVNPVPKANVTDEVYVTSDNEDQTNGSVSKKRRICKRNLRNRVVPAVINCDTSSDTSDSNSSDKRVSGYKRKKRGRKHKQMEKEDLLKMVFCKYCRHATRSELGSRKHISKCPLNPHLKLANNGTTDHVIEATVEISDNEHPTTEDAEIVDLTKDTTEQTNDTTNTISEAKDTIDKTNSSNDTTTNAVVEIIDDENLDPNTDIVYNDLTFSVREKESPTAANSHLESIKVNQFTMKTKLVDDKGQWESILLAIKNNQKKLFSELEVLACNHCTFNSRSSLKMSLHSSSHAGSSKHGVNYSIGYRTVFYCVNCAESYRTAECLRRHMEGCARVSEDKVFMFKVGKVMHCTKCYFDSEDSELVIKHLLKCGDIGVKNEQ